MIQKITPISFLDNDINDLDNSSREYASLDDLIKDQNIATKEVKTVHRRRDLDSLG